MAEVDSIRLKVCTKCKAAKQQSDFHKNRAKKDGLATECKPCAIAKAKAVYEADRDGCRQKMRDNYRAKSEEYKKRARDWETSNPEKVRAIKAAARARSPERYSEYGRRDWLKHGDKRRAAKKIYRAANLERGAEHVRARQTRKQRAMPVWADRDAIRQIYAECRRISESTGIKHHVDHFYPLKGVTVSGLHNEFNLRVIPAAENQSKGSRLIDA